MWLRLLIKWGTHREDALHSKNWLSSQTTGQSLWASMDSIGKRLFRELRDDEGKIGVHPIFLAQQKHIRAGSTSSAWANAAFGFAGCTARSFRSHITKSFLLAFLKRCFAKKLPSSILQELLAKDHGLVVARNHLIDVRHSSGSVGQQLQSSIFRWHVHSSKVKRHSQCWHAIANGCHCNWKAKIANSRTIRWNATRSLSQRRNIPNVAVQ